MIQLKFYWQLGSDSQLILTQFCSSLQEYLYCITINIEGFDFFKSRLYDKVIFYSFLSSSMSFYIILWNYTDQGIKNVRESPKWVNIFKSKLENVGG